MNKFVFRSVALISGVLFGCGMALSGMIEPSKVTGFLDISGNWDPSLAFVMGGALIIFMPSYFLLIKPREQAISGNEICIPNNKVIDKRLLSGAAIFGLGWGIAGVCPGPAVASLALGNIAIVLFFAAMVIGSLITKLFVERHQAQQARVIKVN